MTIHIKSSHPGPNAMPLRTTPIAYDFAATAVRAARSAGTATFTAEVETEAAGVIGRKGSSVGLLSEALQLQWWLLLMVILYSMMLALQAMRGT